jgi:hypothetical protein
MLTCDILGISQEMDFEQNVTVTFLRLRLPDGRVLSVPIEEDVAAVIVAHQVETRGVPQPGASRAQFVEAPEPASPTFRGDDAAREYDEPATTPVGDGVFIFGGQEEPTSRESQAILAEVRAAITREAQVASTERTMTAPSRIQQLPNGKLVVPSMTVPRNDSGYPMVRGNGVDPDIITGAPTQAQDEDGIGQV